MSRDKQTEIEEMVFALTDAQHAFDRAWKECFRRNGEVPDRENVFYAKYLVEKKGYRKTTDIAREIFEEIEKLRAENADCRLGFTLLEDAFQRLEKINEQTKSDTVRKMLERITEHATNGYPRKVRLDVIDQIAKEMLEGE